MFNHIRRSTGVGLVLVSQTCTCISVVLVPWCSRIFVISLFQSNEIRGTPCDGNKKVYSVMLMALDAIDKGYDFKFTLLNTVFITLLPKKMDALEVKDVMP